KNKLGEDNNSKISLTTDGIDLSNANVGEKVGDVITPEDREFRTEHQAKYKYIQMDFDRAINGMVALTGSVFRGAGSYVFIKSGVGLLLVPEPTLTTKIAGVVVIGYGVGEAIFSFLDGVESGQDVYYGVTNQKNKKSVNFGKNLLCEEGYMLLDATSGAGAPMMYQFSNYTRVMAEGEAAQRALANNSSQVSNPKIEVETPKIKPVENIVGTKTGNKELNNAINTREKGHYLKQLDEKKAPVFATISDEKLTSFQNEVSKAGVKLDLKTGELIGPKGGKGKVVGTTLDGKIVANMSGRNVIFENGKQNPVSAGSFKKFEIPKTNEAIEVLSEVIAKDNTKKLSENMFNGFLDKAKSKITGKPVAQVQLERVGIKSEVKDIGLKVDGTTPTGKKIDKALDNNLGETFKTYDHYDKVTKTATSVKSVDMTSKTYTSGSELSSKLNSDLKAIKDFTRYELKTVKLENKDIENRILKIVINNEPLNKSQMENLKKVVEHATEEGIKVEAVILK
ncbi:hypothetical protein, partial [uncultured Fusobacterium sp.]|uniref:endonuclease toxin domain-containing protein n=1 Tax=uncultured Fusobacterium sp. TaxID=159267 RepID=UPI0025CFD2F4